MTDTIPTEDLPTPVATALAPETFNVADWLGDTQYATKTVELFNKGELLQELAELSAFVLKQEDLKEQRKVNRKTLIGSITDEDDEGENHDELIAEAQRGIDAIIASLKGTGIVVHLRGIAPGKRKVIEDKISRSIKPKPAKYEEIEGERVVVEEAVPGGRQSPEWSRKFQNELAGATIVKIVSPTGSVQEGPLQPEAVAALGDALMPSEFNRLANAAFDVNFFSYDIDSKVTVDF